MKIIATVAAAMAFVLTQASNGLAVDLVNEDRIPYTVTLEEGGKRKVLKIGPGTSIKAVCDECAIGIPGDDGFEAFGNDVIIIRKGVLYIAS